MIGIIGREMTVISLYMRALGLAAHERGHLSALGNSLGHFILICRDVCMTYFNVADTYCLVGDRFQHFRPNLL